MKKLCIIGAGGFGREIYYGFRHQLSNVGFDEQDVLFIDDDLNKNNLIDYLEIKSFEDFDPKLYTAIIGIGNSITRKNVVSRLPSETDFISLVHDSAIVMDENIIINEGSIIAAGSILTTNIIIGKHCQLNLNTTIGHDCVIGDFFTTAPGVHISGNCNIGDNVYFGTNSSVRNNVNICSNVTIGMGAVVTKDITEEGIYIGNPLKKLEKN